MVLFGYSFWMVGDSCPPVKLKNFHWSGILFLVSPHSAGSFIFLCFNTFSCIAKLVWNLVDIITFFIYLNWSMTSCVPFCTSFLLAYSFRMEERITVLISVDLTSECWHRSATTIWYIIVCSYCMIRLQSVTVNTEQHFLKQLQWLM